MEEGEEEDEAEDAKEAEEAEEVEEKGQKRKDQSTNDKGYNTSCKVNEVLIFTCADKNNF